MKPDEIHQQSLEAIRTSLDVFSIALPPPVLKKVNGSYQYVCQEELVKHALVMKLVRQYSALLALNVLLDEGLFLDAGATMRVLDDMEQDVKFLLGPVLSNQAPEQNHDKFIADFFQEEFDHESIVESTQKRDTVSRKKIRAYNARIYKMDEYDAKLTASLENANSGYVHGAGDHILGIFNGSTFTVRMPRSAPPLILM